MLYVKLKANDHRLKTPIAPWHTFCFLRCIIMQAHGHIEAASPGRAATEHASPGRTATEHASPVRTASVQAMWRYLVLRVINWLYELRESETRALLKVRRIAPKSVLERFAFARIYENLHFYDDSMSTEISATSGAEQPANTSAAPTSIANSQEERRIALDGQQYTIAEFENYYGQEHGIRLWERAGLLADAFGEVALRTASDEVETHSREPRVVEYEY